MSFESMLEPKKIRAPMITLTGEEGIGKTTFAATFPKPIFLRFEDGTGGISPEIQFDQFKIIRDYSMFREQLLLLLKEKHDYKTVVIDTVTQAGEMFTKDILSSDHGKGNGSMNTCHGGYGAGYGMLAAKHASLRAACNHVNESRDLAFVFILHNQVTTIDPPDSESYSKYSLQLHKDSAPIYLNNVDAVIHMKLDSVVLTDKTTGSAKVTQDTGRVLVCHKTAAQVSKNRFHITEELAAPEGVNPLLKLIPFYTGEVK